MPEAKPRPALRALAERLGIEPGYRSLHTERWVEVSDATRERLAAAMGWDASSEAAAARALEALATQALPAAPRAETCLHVDALLGDQRAFGLWANLYTLRSRSDPGFGTFAELALLVERAAAEGAAFVGMSPLHALASEDGEVCPYTPLSRLYRSELYLDIARLPELAHSETARAELASGAVGAELAALRAAPRLDPARSARALAPVLRALHAAFCDARGDGADARRAAFAAYAREQGDALWRFATFRALAERLGAGHDWRRWPSAYQDPDAPAVRALRREAAPEVERHAWLQFALDAQLGEISARARDAGLALGLYADLALGSAAGGADTWGWPGLFAQGVSVGAPPDAFAPGGQDWSFPPLDPHALRSSGYAFWQALLDANLRHVGALRVDHALGLRRLFWIPEGASPAEGAYVRQPEADLLALLGRASRAHRALIVGEDLGNVPDGFSEAIQRHGMLASRVLIFERDGEAFRPATAYPRTCLATANTHDLAPLAGWLADADLPLRRRAGQLADDEALADARAARARERSALVARLVADGWLSAADAGGTPQPDAFGEALTRFLCSTPAVLVGLALDDLAGETEPINLPGVAPARHASWQRRMTTPLEALFARPLARRMLDAVPAERRSARRLV